MRDRQGAPGTLVFLEGVQSISSTGATVFWLFSLRPCPAPAPPKGASPQSQSGLGHLAPLGIEVWMLQALRGTQARVGAEAGRQTGIGWHSEAT